MQFDELLRNINNELNNADARIFPFNEGKELMQALKENQLAIDSLTVISEWGDKYYLCFNGKYNKHTYKKHLKNLLNELISHISGKLLSPGVVSDKISFIMDTSVSLGFRFIEDSFLLNYFSHPPLPPLIPKDENLNKIVDNLIDKEFSEKFSSVSKEFFDQLIRILESNYNFVSSIAPIKITPDISSFERSITSYNFLHSHLLSTQIDFHISNNNVTFTFNDSSEYTDYKSLMNKTFKAFKNEIHVTISSNNYSSDEIYWFFKSLIYKLDNLLQEFIKIDDSFEEDGIHYDNIYFTRTESQTCNYVFHSFPEKESSYDDVYYHHFQSIIDISRFLYIQYMLINNLIEYSTFIVKHYYDLISYTPSVNSPNTELFQEEQSIVPFTSFELKDFKKKEKILLKVFQKLIDLNYIIAEKESLNDQTSFLEIFSGLKKTKHVIWNKSAESLHVFIDLLIDKHSLVENCNRWMIAENCFRPEKGSFNSVKLSRISRKPALSHLRNFKKVITLFN